MSRGAIDRTPRVYDPGLEAMTPEARAEYQRSRLGEVIPHAYGHSRHLRRRMDGAGLKPEEVRTPEDLLRFPVLKKSALPELQKADPPFGGLLTVPVAELRRIYMSPGPTYEPEPPEGDYWRLARAFFAAGFRKGDVVVNAFSYHLVTAGLMCDEALATIGCTVVPTGVGNTEMQVDVMRHVQATGYAGTPGFLSTILEKAEAQGLDIRRDLCLEVAFVSGAMLPESLRTLLREKSGIQVAQAYATSDLGLVAYECERRQGLHIADDLVVDVVDPGSGAPLPPGERGEVVVTNFDWTYPLIRFGTGDLSALNPEPCGCGRTSLRLVGVLGRVDQLTKIRGMFVHPAQVDAAVSGFPEVLRYQVVVSRKGFDDVMTLRVEAEGGGSDALRAGLQQAVRDTTKLRAEVEFVAAGAIPPDAGKIDDQRKWD